MQEAGTKQSYTTEQRYRDVMKRVILRQGPDAMYLLISLENQSEVHYAMPVRNMLNDVLRYVRQIETIHRSYQIRREQKATSKSILNSKAEFLSGIGKKDKLLPVITIVVLFNDEEWDGPRSLHEMLEVKNKEILNFVQDYKLHLIAPGELEELELQKFQTSLREVLTFIKYAKNKEQMERLFKNSAFRFCHMERQAVRMIEMFTGTEIIRETEQEEIDMCKAWDDMGRQKREEGRQEGRLDACNQIIKNMLANGFSEDKIMAIVGCDREMVNSIRWS